MTTLAKASDLSPAERLARFTRADLGLQPTPLEELPRLSEKLGVRLLVKRDDTMTLAFGGNKVRQLEYYLGPAIETQADCVLITGAIQSNFVRLCVAAARKLGMKPVVQLERRVPKNDELYNTSGNVLLDHLLGAEIHYFDGGDDEAAADACLDEIAAGLARQGASPHVIHLGLGHPPLGGLGYFHAALEARAQLNEAGIEPHCTVVPTGSGLTHAGFLCGALAQGWSAPVHGICVRRDGVQQHARITGRANEINALLGIESPVPADAVRTHDEVLAPGYGQMNQRLADALQLAAVTEGLLLDPVYSGRAFAGLVHLVETGQIAQGETVLFIHTGGLPAVFGYQRDLESWMT